MEKKKVVIGLSGGVDSSTGAYLLKKQGYDVIGVTMKTWDGKEVCGDDGMIEEAAKVAEQLAIPFHVLDFTEEFQKDVADYFVSEYCSGRTPNPCVVCNHRVKWEALLNRCQSFGADYIATGHYARICKLENGRYTLRKSVTEKKDQTYALYRLSQEQLAHTLMPVGEYEKDEIRTLADKLSLTCANSPDSMEICFIPDHDYAGYIERSINKSFPEGNYVDKNGNVLGRHRGIIHYTIGQRKGLNLALGHPVFVTRICPETNEVVIGEEEDLLSDRLVASQPNWMSIESLTEPMRVMAKIRYNHTGAMCTIMPAGNGEVLCKFDSRQRAITPGQSVVFYENDIVVGGAVIEHI